MKKYLIAVIVIFISSNSLADGQFTDKTVKSVFVENESMAGFYANEGLGDCLFSLIYIDLSNEAGKGKLSLLLIAKTTGSNLNRIDYTQSAPGGICYLKGVHME